MIPDQPRPGIKFASFRFDAGPLYLVTLSEQCASAYVFLGDAFGPVVAKVHRPFGSDTRFEFAELWRGNPPEWIAEFKSRTLRAFESSCDRSPRLGKGAAS